MLIYFCVYLFICLVLLLRYLPLVDTIKRGYTDAKKELAEIYKEKSIFFFLALIILGGLLILLALIFVVVAAPIIILLKYKNLRTKSPTKPLTETTKMKDEAKEPYVQIIRATNLIRYYKIQIFFMLKVSIIIF